MKKNNMAAKYIVLVFKVFLYVAAICLAAGKGLKKTKCPAVRNFLGISFEIPFSNRLKVFYLHLESPSDQENRSGFTVERLWFLEHRVESTPFLPING